MTGPRPLAPAPADAVSAVRARLTAPGAPFETVVEPVLGTPIPVLRHRVGSLLAVLDAGAALGEREYLVTENRRLTYAAHDTAVTALAAALRDRYGVGRGDRVGILAANCAEWVIAFWAAQRLGAIAVGYNAWWAAPEIEHGLGHTTPAVLITDEARAARLAGLDAGVPVLTVTREIPALIEEFDGATIPTPPIEEDDPAVVLYTSGTSGRPKGAVHSHRNLVAVIDQHRFNDAVAAELTGRSVTGPRGRRFLLTSPLFHIASLHNLVLPRMATGDTAVIHEGAFDAERVAALIARERITNWGAMPTMATRLLRADLSDHDLSSLTSLSLNSAPSSADLQHRLRERLPTAGHALATSYGMTECATAATLASPAELAAHPDTVGRPILGVALEIRDPGGHAVPDGVEGEIHVRSPYVMLGYWDDPAATAAAITADRWLRTGDLGVLREGRLYLSGRRGDLILRGGENVYPTEIEQRLERHPAVRECAVVGLPDEDLGQLVAAVVSVSAQVSPEELTEFAREGLAYYKVPARWHLTTDALPRNATGKVIRPAVTALAALAAATGPDRTPHIVADPN